MRHGCFANLLLFVVGLGISLLVACNSSPQTGPVGSATADGTVVRQNQVPVSIIAAFNSEHPYAKITQTAVQSDQGNPTAYVIQYTRQDGSTGKATYSPTGALMKDN